MTSIGSLSFLIQTSSSSCSDLRKRRSACWKRPNFVAIYGRNKLDPNGAVCKMGSFGVGDGELLRKGLRAAGRSDSTEDEGKERRNYKEDVADDSFWAIIKQSKEVLAKQKEILRQMEEGRKLVSSVNFSSANIEMDSPSLNESDSYFQSMNRNSTGAHTASEKSDESSNVDISASPPIADGKSLHNKSLQDEYSGSDALGLVRETGSDTVHSEILSPRLWEASSHFLINEENLDDLEEANVEGTSGMQYGAPEDGIKDSPPLAGANVMNVILVAAECAPWSKTAEGATTTETDTETADVDPTDVGYESLGDQT